MSATYSNSEHAKQYVIETADILRSNWAIDRVKLEHNFQVKEGERDLDWRIMLVTGMKALNEDMSIWGNYKSREIPDHVGFRGMNFVDTSEMMIEVSKRHPSILVYRGIDSSRAKNNQVCYGGYFIQNGEPIVVEELNCLKKITDKVDS